MSGAEHPFPWSEDAICRPSAENDATCSYENVWTDEVGTIPVCKVHGNNSRHVESDDPHRPCLSVDPYPNDPRRPIPPESPFGPLDENGHDGHAPQLNGLLADCPGCVTPPGESITMSGYGSGDAIPPGDPS